MEMSSVNNEFRAINKLCLKKHPNVIEVLKVDTFSNRSYAFIDMELCDMDLDDYNKSIWKLEIVQGSVKGTREKGIWNIMMQIANGIAYIHSLAEVHRDLKPKNGYFILNHVL